MCNTHGCEVSHSRDACWVVRRHVAQTQLDIGNVRCGFFASIVHFMHSW